jgi:hypothetical protein
MPWLATGASLCGALKPPVRTEISLRSDGADELGRDLVVCSSRSRGICGHGRRRTGDCPGREYFDRDQPADFADWAEAWLRFASLYVGLGDGWTGR